MIAVGAKKVQEMAELITVASKPICSFKHLMKDLRELALADSSITKSVCNCKLAYLQI